MSLKSAIAPLLHRLGHAAGTSLTRAKEFRVARIITFHAVGVRTCPTDAFTAQLEYLKQNFRVVPLAELVKALATARPTSPTGSPSPSMTARATTAPSPRSS